MHDERVIARGKIERIGSDAVLGDDRRLVGPDRRSRRKQSADERAAIALLVEPSGGIRVRRNSTRLASRRSSPVRATAAASAWTTTCSPRCGSFYPSLRCTTRCTSRPWRSFATSCPAFQWWRSSSRVSTRRCPKRLGLRRTARLAGKARRPPLRLPRVVAPVCCGPCAADPASPAGRLADGVVSSRRQLVDLRDRDGQSVDCSFGFSPQSGVEHAARSGELDPFAVFT